MNHMSSCSAPVGARSPRRAKRRAGCSGPDGVGSVEYRLAELGCGLPEEVVLLLCRAERVGESPLPGPVSSLQGLERYDAGIRRLAERYGEFPYPQIVGGRETLARMSALEIDQLVAEFEQDLIEALEDEAGPELREEDAA